MTRSHLQGIPPAVRQLINRTAAAQARMAEVRYSEALFDMVQAAIAGGMSVDMLDELVRDHPTGATNLMEVIS